MAESFEASYGGTTESQLVRDVIYTCQGIDGEAIKYDDRTEAYLLKKSIATPESTRSVIVSGPGQYGKIIHPRIHIRNTTSSDGFLSRYSIAGRC